MQVGLGRFVVGRDGGEASFGGGDFGCDPGLLVSEEFEGDRVGVVGVEQLLALAFELLQAALLGAFSRLALRRSFASSSVRNERSCGISSAGSWTAA